MTRLIAVLWLALMAGAFTRSAVAQDMSGEWTFKRQAYNGVHSGTIVIDRQGDARLKATGPVQTYVQCGSVQTGQGTMEIVFTYAKGEKGGYNTDHFYCTASGREVFGCYNIDAGGAHEPIIFLLTRVGGIPAAAAARLDNVCPVKASPSV